MKKSILFLSFLLFAALFARGSDTKEVRLTFDGSDFSFAQENGAYSISAEKFPVIYDTDTLAPALPYYVVNVLIAPTQEFQGLTVRGGESLLRSDIRVPPNKLPVPTNALDAYTPNRVFDYALSNYPSEEVRYVSTNVLGNYKYVSLLVCPLRYDAQNHSLYLKQNLQITLSLGTVSKAAPIAAYPESESFHAKKRREIELLVYNSDDIDALYPTAARQNSVANSFPVKYLVITNEELKPAFQRLANWKTTKGVKSKVLTVEEISQKYSDPIMPMRIKRAIMEYKGQVEYVLLGGDVEVVPSLICTLPMQIKSPTVDVPADLYYASFADLNWDKNQNGLFAEFDTSGDMVNAMADVAISRLSVTTLSDAIDMVDRLVDYEKSPKEEMLSDKMLMSGIGLGGVQQSGENLYKKFIEPYWNGRMLRFYDTKTDFEGDTRYRVNPENLQTQLENGYLFVDMMCHGWTQQWGFLDNWSNYMVSQAQELQNKGYTFITTISCYVNCFDTKPDSLCLGEGFMLNKNSNVLAFVGNCREGWYLQNYPPKSEVPLFETFYLGIMKYKMSIGEAVSFAKNQYMPLFNYPKQKYGWNIRVLNPLADPEMHPYLQTPNKFNNVQIDYGNGNLKIGVGIDSCQVCLSKFENNNLVYYKIVNFDKDVDVADVPNDVTVCITKYGYIPYTMYVLDGDLVYLQNRNIDSDAKITGTEIIAGSHVDSNQSAGSVTIRRGQAILETKNGAIIKNDFKVFKGGAMRVITKK